MATEKHASDADRYVGTLVGESTSGEFRLAVAHETIREQDIIAVDVDFRSTDLHAEPERLRVWAKVQRIERMNPLFPSEAGHELAATHTSPFDTVLSLSREMVTAVCQVLGSEPLSGKVGGKLDHLRYPAQPATSAYRPDSADIARIVLGELATKSNRALNVASLSNRLDVDVKVDGHVMVTRHLAILAMTGAGKSWTARRIIEELAAKNYPMVIFDPHGDYTGLADLPTLNGRVKRYFAQFPIFEQTPESIVMVVESLTGGKLPKTHREKFDELFQGAKDFAAGDGAEVKARVDWLRTYVGSHFTGPVLPNLYYLADFVHAVVKATKNTDKEALDKIVNWSGQDQLGNWSKGYGTWLESLPGTLRGAAKRLHQMEEVSKKVAKSGEPLPLLRTDLVKYGQVSIVALAGYTSDFQATIYTLVAEAIFTARVSDTLKLPVLLILEEAHNFAPAQALTEADKRAIVTTKQIAQEGRKFGVGLVLISQRPSRLDETTLSQCNSFIIMRMVNPADQNYVRKVIESLGEDEAKMLPDLDVGEALLSGQFINFPVLVRIRKPESTGEHEEEDAFVTLEEARKAAEQENRQQRQSPKSAGR